MRLFVARYAGTCGACFEPIEAGDEVGYSAENVLTCGECWRDGSPAVRVAFPGVEAPAPEAIPLPRGKSVRDRCPRCFQIPSTSGNCECE